MPVDFSVADLWLPAGALAAIGILLVFLTTRSLLVSLVVVGLKTVVFLVYWLTVDFIPSSDDLFYFLTSVRFDTIDWAVFLRDPSGFYGSAHWGYPLLNWVVTRAFGYQIFTPIAVNIALTYLGSILLFRTLLLYGLPRNLALFAVVFYLISPDVLVWSSFYNFKDTVVQILTILYIYLVSKAVLGRPNLWVVLALLVPIGILTTIRIYVPVLMIVHFVSLQILTSRPGWNRMASTVLVTTIFVYAMTLYLRTGLPIPPLDELRSIDEISFGIGKITLTPVPWQTSGNKAGQLFIPGWLHWTFLPFALYGLGISWLKYRGAMIMVTYVIGLFVLLAVFTDLLGPRHRFQVSFVFTVFEAIGIYYLLLKPVSWSKSWTSTKVAGPRPREEVGQEPARAIDMEVRPDTGFPSGSGRAANESPMAGD